MTKPKRIGYRITLDAVAVYRAGGITAVRQLWYGLSPSDRAQVSVLGNLTMLNLGLRPTDPPADRFDSFVIACANGVPLTRAVKVTKGGRR